MPSIQLPGTGYAKLVLHACKHPTVAVNGILIGRLDGKVRYDTFFFSSHLFTCHSFVVLFHLYVEALAGCRLETKWLLRHSELFPPALFGGRGLEHFVTPANDNCGLQKNEGVVQGTWLRGVVWTTGVTVQSL